LPPIPLPINEWLSPILEITTQNRYVRYRGEQTREFAGRSTLRRCVPCPFGKPACMGVRKCSRIGHPKNERRMTDERRGPSWTEGYAGRSPGTV
jgi:hypothetical protein